MVLTKTSTLQLSYYADRIIVSKEPLVNGSASIKKKEIMLQNRSTVYNGFMSPATKRKVRTILTTWINAVKFENKHRDISLMKIERKLTFATLSLSDEQKHDDNWIKRNLLNRFLISMQRNYGIKYYFWRAEKQKNGRIHFHIILDSYIDKRDLQSEWNSIQQDNGYLDRFFFEKRRYNAPSTHIKTVPEGNNVVDYLLKYVTKNPNDIEDASLQVKGRIWGCSKELKVLKPYSSGEISEIGQSINSLAEAGEVDVYDHEHFQIYFLDVEQFLRKYHKRVFANMKLYYADIYNQLYHIGLKMDDQKKRSNEPIKNYAKPPEQLSLFGEMIVDELSNQRYRSRMNH